MKVDNANRQFFLIKPSLQEDLIWERHVESALKDLPGNLLHIWNYAFTEIFNNAIDHSDGTVIWISIQQSERKTRIDVGDDGEGIFRRLKRLLNLEDHKHAILELAKGKVTTDPKNHTGEGIFFTSRMMDRFVILSRGLTFVRDPAIEDSLLEGKDYRGTSVIMELANDSTRRSVEVFDQFTSRDGEFGFDKTVVPVSLAAENGKTLVSRSQAKRLSSRIDRFRTVVLDFEGVTSLGQGFADQIFRVFAREHPNVSLSVINASPEVDYMIQRSKTK